MDPPVLFNRQDAKGAKVRTERIGKQSQYESPSEHPHARSRSTPNGAYWFRGILAFRGVQDPKRLGDLGVLAVQAFPIEEYWCSNPRTAGGQAPRFRFNQRIPASLATLASWRLDSRCASRKNYALDSCPQDRHIEIDQQAKLQLFGLEVRNYLGLVNRRQGFYSFQLDQKRPVYQEI